LPPSLLPLPFCLPSLHLFTPPSLHPSLPPLPHFRLRHAITELRGISPSRKGGLTDRGSGMALSHGSSEEMLSIKRYRNSTASRGRSQVHNKYRLHHKGEVSA
jgi:hypothetical protein